MSSPLSIIRALEGRSILLTGATGFLGKLILEKILRSCPSVGSVYVLVRPRKGSTALQRLESEVINSEVFNRLKREIGVENFKALVADKIRPLPGELTLPDIGLTNELLQHVYEHVQIVIHCAAIVDFNERLDRAVELNTLGSLRLLEIAKKCREMDAFIHVSTCYVNSNKRGWVDEKLYPLGFDPEEMVQRVRNMKESELERISVSGLLGDWPNTYTFTKAMTEHLLEKHRGTIPLAIVRPSIIGCSWQEPVPGWVDVISAAGAVYMSVGMGVLKFVPGSENNNGDVIPADYVVNAILVAIPSIARQNRSMVFQAASSTENPMYWGDASQVIVDFFTNQPPPRGVGKPAFKMIPSPQDFQLQFFLRYSIPSAMLNSIATIGNKESKKKAALFQKLVWRARVVIESFRHFTDNEWSFSNVNTRTAGLALNDKEREIFPLTLTTLDWQDYNYIFSYGLSKFVLKSELIDLSPNEKRQLYLEMNKEPWISPRRDYTNKNAVSTPKKLEANNWAVTAADYLKNTFIDFNWVKSRLSTRPVFPPQVSPHPRPVQEMKLLVLKSKSVQEAIAKIAQQLGPIRPSGKNKNASTTAVTPAVASNDLTDRLKEVEGTALNIMDKMFGDSSLPVVSGLGYFFRKIWRRIYENIKVEKSGLAKAQEMAMKHPLIFIPTHRSYVDFLVISYLCFSCNLPMPYIAAGEDFLGLLLVRWLFRHSGAFFIRRSFDNDPLYTAIFNQYIKQLLQDGQSLEFFIEGTRSRSGKMLHPKTGMLSMITDIILEQRINDAIIVPITINYEKTMESNLYSNELLGENKIKESLKSLLKSSHILNANFGSISVVFQDPISVKEYAAQFSQEVNNTSTASSAPAPAPAPTPVPAPAPAPVAAPAAAPVAAAAGAGVGVGAGAAAVVVDESKFLIPVSQKKQFNNQLAYRIIYSLSAGTEIMPSHLIATILLMYRQGITRQQLLSKFEWLRAEISKRGGRLVGFEGFSRVVLVDKSLKFLQDVVIQRRKDIWEPAITTRAEYANMLVLGHYRNKLAHLFFLEGLWACALYALHQNTAHHHHEGTTNNTPAPAPVASTSLTSSSSTASNGTVMSVSLPSLIQEVNFLYTLLRREFVFTPRPDHAIDLMATLHKMIDAGILRQTGESIEVATTGETHFSFLCAVFWPFIDSYYVAAMVLFSLQPTKVLEENVLLQRTQWLATTLYHEQMISFYEACSMDTLKNAFDVLTHWKVIKSEKQKKKKNALMEESSGSSSSSGSTNLISLVAPYQDESKLQELVVRIGSLRKLPSTAVSMGRKNALRRNLIADIPILAKL